MAAVDLNTVRKTIESRLNDVFRIGPTIPLVFNNVPFDDSSADQYIQCITIYNVCNM